MKLTPLNVIKVAFDMLYDEGTELWEMEGAIEVEGIFRTFCFDPKKVKARAKEIKIMLREVPEAFSSCLQPDGRGGVFMRITQDTIPEGWSPKSVEILMVLATLMGTAKRRHYHQDPEEKPHG